jgi:predicted HicB family RNase H-like nuclease
MSTVTNEAYKAHVEYDEEAQLFHGEVMDLRDVVTFQGKSVEEAKQAFAESIEDYLAFCKQPMRT